jgi:hypothetical protein
MICSLDKPVIRAVAAANLLMEARDGGVYLNGKSLLTIKCAANSPNYRGDLSTGGKLIND